MNPSKAEMLELCQLLRIDATGKTDSELEVVLWEAICKELVVQVNQPGISD